MRLKKVQTYQPVLFNKQNETHFDTANPRFHDLEMTYDKTINAVFISLPGGDSLYVFSTNLAYVKPADDVKASETVLKKVSKA